jgi:radical SAM superfamily enzyme YgiQ (UPF0313 family)
MSNLGFHNLFDRVSHFHGVRTVRFFIEKNTKLFSPDAFSPKKLDIFKGRGDNLKGFDALFFTLSFEMDYINLLKMLKASSIPLIKNERREKSPLIIVGGIAVTSNPEPLWVFSDILFLGDMEGKIEKIMSVLFESGFRLSSSLIEQLEQIEGVWMQNERIPKRSITTVLSVPSHSVILTRNTEFSNMFLLEIIRGCRNTCAFCMTRCAGSPVRNFTPGSIFDTVMPALSYTRRVGLIGPVLTDHPDLIKIVNRINGLDATVSFSSLRADDFSDEIAVLLGKNKQRSLTFAPETGTDSLRSRIGKNLSNHTILESVRRACEFGIRKFRFYFMYGLPGEREEDIDGIIELVRKTLKLFKGAGYSLHLSINPFIPKRGTSFAHAHLFHKDYYKEVQKRLSEGLKNKEKISFRYESLRFLYTHAILSTGGRETGVSLYRAFTGQSFADFERHAERVLVHGYKEE